MNSFRDFVNNGKVGQLGFGISRQQAIQLLGAPSDWLGKRTIIGEPCAIYDQSELWFYYEGSAGIRFDTEAISIEILLYPEHFPKCGELFRQWPVSGIVTMGEWRAALVKHGIVFRESDPESLNYWIVASETCVVGSLPFNDGELLPGHARLVNMVSKFPHVEAMRRDCGFLTI